MTIPEPTAADLAIELLAVYEAKRFGNSKLVPALIRRLAAAEAEVERLRAELDPPLSMGQILGMEP